MRILVDVEPQSQEIKPTLKQSERPSYRKWYEENKEQLVRRAYEWRKENPDKVKEIRRKHYAKKRLDPEFKERTSLYNKERYWRDPEKSRKSAKESRDKLRAEFLVEYGHICACCGETHEAFRTLEHKNRDGAEHRKEFHCSISQLRDLKRRGWPKDNYEILCFNCNRASWERKICPHREEKQV